MKIFFKNNIKIIYNNILPSSVENDNYPVGTQYYNSDLNSIRLKTTDGWKTLKLE
jgi:hypothetical protein